MTTSAFNALAHSIVPLPSLLSVTPQRDKYSAGHPIVHRIQLEFCMLALLATSQSITDTLW